MRWMIMVGIAAFGQTPAELDNAKAMFRAEHSEAQKVARYFVAGVMGRAEDLARRADIERAAGRLAQANELFRQARWQLPYLPAALPEHVSRVLGNFRLRHSMEVTAVAYSPDGRWLATASLDRTVKLWDLANGRELRAYTKHSDPVRVIAFSPDGKHIASGGADPEIHVWNPETGETIRTLAGVGNHVEALVYSKDGKTLAAGHAGKAGSGSGFVTLTDVANGERLRTIQDFRTAVKSIAFTSKGDVFAVGTVDGTVRLYEFPKVISNANHPEYWSKQEPSVVVTHVSFTADDKALIRCGTDGIRLFATPTPGQAFQVSAPLRTIDNPGPEIFYRVAMTSADSKTLIAGGSDGILRMIDADTGLVVGSLRGHSGPMRSVTLHPRGVQIASTGADCVARLWDFDIVLQSRQFAGHDGAVWSASFSPDGKSLVSASADGTVRVWDVGGTKAIHVLKGHAGPATLALFTPDGKRIVSGGADRTIRIWDAEKGTPLQELAGHLGTITALDITGDGKRLISGGADRLLKIWDLDAGREVLQLTGPASVVAAIAIHPDGRSFAVGNVDQTIAVYDMAGKLIRRWPGHGIAVGGLAFSPNGKWLASCGSDNIVRVWAFDRPGETPISLVGHSGPLSGVAFRKDNQHIVSCGADLSVKLWKLEADGGKEIQTYRGHRDWVASAAFSPDGFHVVTASVDRSIRIWEITSKDLPLVPEHSGTVDAVAFSPDGKTLASGGSDRTIKIWDRATGQELTTIRGHALNVISILYSHDGKTLISSGYDLAIRFWDPATGKEWPRSKTQQASFTGVEAPVPLMSQTKDGKTLLAWVHNPEDTRHTKIAGFDLEGNEKFSFSDQGRKVHSLCFSGDGRRAATGASNGSVRIWDLEKQAPLPGGDWFFFDAKVGVADLGLTPTGDTIVVTSDTGEIKIGDVGKKEIRKTIQGHTGRISACVIAPDGRRFVTLDVENLAILWDLETGKELRRWDLRTALQGRTSGVVSIAFAPDGRQIALGNANTTVFLLDTP